MAEEFTINRPPGDGQIGTRESQSRIRLSIVFLALCAAIAPVGLTALTPALPLIKTSLAVTSSDVQLLLTVYMITLACGQLILGPVSDWMGRRILLLAGGLVFTLSGQWLTMCTTELKQHGRCQRLQPYLQLRQSFHLPLEVG